MILGQLRPGSATAKNLSCGENKLHLRLRSAEAGKVSDIVLGMLLRPTSYFMNRRKMIPLSARTALLASLPERGSLTATFADGIQGARPSIEQARWQDLEMVMFITSAMRRTWMDGRLPSLYLCQKSTLSISTQIRGQRPLSRPERDTSCSWQSINMVFVAGRQGN
jgi:hypothetical protein